jgi:ATP-binding cassette, subfamily B, bacterial MsbA
MGKYARIFTYLKPYRGQLVAYIVCILLSTIFSLLSFGMLMPFLELLFVGKSGAMDLASQSKGGSGVMDWVRTQMNDFGKAHEGNKMAILLLICGIMMGSIFLKNLFFYISLYILNPLKNKVVTSFRADLYDKVLAPADRLFYRTAQRRPHEQDNQRYFGGGKQCGKYA